MELSVPMLYLVLNATIFMMIGLLCGAPYTKAIKSNAPPDVLWAWRVAHASIPLGAILMWSMAALVPYLKMELSLQWAIAGTLIFSGWGFCIALPLGPIVRYRGLSPGSSLGANVVYIGNVIGAGFSTIGVLLFLYGIIKALP